MGRPDLFPLVNKILEGRLAEHLRAWRSDGLSLQAIVLRLHEQGVTVSTETVRRWCRRVETEEHAR